MKTDYLSRKPARIDPDLDIRECPTCGKKVPRFDMDFTRDCHGIPFRLVCYACRMKLMAKGYDGEYLLHGSG